VNPRLSKAYQNASKFVRHGCKHIGDLGWRTCTLGRGQKKELQTQAFVFLKTYCQNLEEQLQPKLDRAGTAPPLYGIALGYVGRVLGLAECRGTSEIETLTQVLGTVEKIEGLRSELRG
jgi:hypothetical protein